MWTTLKASWKITLYTLGRSCPFRLSFSACLASDLLALIAAWLFIDLLRSPDKVLRHFRRCSKVSIVSSHRLFAGFALFVCLLMCASPGELALNASWTQGFLARFNCFLVIPDESARTGSVKLLMSFHTYTNAHFRCSLMSFRAHIEKRLANVV